jgi:hypothetical protein
MAPANPLQAFLQHGGDRIIEIRQIQIPSLRQTFAAVIC